VRQDDTGAGAPSPFDPPAAAPRAEATATSPAAPEAAAAESSMAGATRSEHVVHTLPFDWGTLPLFLAAPLARVDRDAVDTQLLVVTPDAETALAVAEAALALRGEDAPVVVPVTRAERAVRQLRGRPAPVVAGTPAALAACVRASALRLGALRTLVIAWADAILETPGARELDAVIGEAARDSARVLVTTQTTDAVEALVERALRRPRRVQPPGAGGAPAAVPLHFVPVMPAARPDALRRVLDELDPASIVVVAASDAGADEARRTLRTLGYDDAPGPVAPSPEVEAARALGAAAGAPPVVARVVTDGGELPASPALLVLYDVPTSRDTLTRIAAASPAAVVALAQPRQLGALRALTSGAVRALPLGEVARRAGERDAALRLELRAELERGMPPRELFALEPLLAEFDAVELAVAAVRLLDHERARRSAVAAPAAAGAEASRAAGAAPTGPVRLFVSIGSRDGVRPGDLVGAIAGEAGIPGDKLGKIDVRDAFSLVEVAPEVVDKVLQRADGITIKGRRVQVRRERDGGDAARGERRGGGAGMGFDRGDRRSPRDDRRSGPAGPAALRGPRTGGPRAGGGGGAGGTGGGRAFDTRRDGPRSFGGPDDRPVAERAEQRGEWAERAERLRRATRRPVDPPPGETGGPADAEG
jgi:ATP-dependent RNA helicase DeaD